MTANETKLGKRFGLYVVGVFDVLGQKRSLYKLPSARTPGAIQRDEVLDYVKGTAGRVLRVRTLFSKQFSLAVQTVNRIAREHGASSFTG